MIHDEEVEKEFTQVEKRKEKGIKDRYIGGKKRIRQGWDEEGENE